MPDVICHLEDTYYQIDKAMIDKLHHKKSSLKHGRPFRCKHTPSMSVEPGKSKDIFRSDMVQGMSIFTLP